MVGTFQLVGAFLLVFAPALAVFVWWLARLAE
jgi:hypothetical protein